MKQTKSTTIEVMGSSITILPQAQGDYISLTDMVRSFDGGSALIEQWLKNRHRAVSRSLGADQQPRL